jgi:hypothetical protein
MLLLMALLFCSWRGLGTVKRLLGLEEGPGREGQNLKGSEEPAGCGGGDVGGSGVPLPLDGLDAQFCLSDKTGKSLHFKREVTETSLHSEGEASLRVGHVQQGQGLTLVRNRHPDVMTRAAHQVQWSRRPDSD